MASKNKPRRNITSIPSRDRCTNQPSTIASARRRNITQSSWRKRQTLLFSATFSDAIRLMAKELLRDPLSIEVSPRNTTAKGAGNLFSKVSLSRTSRAN